VPPGRSQAVASVIRGQLNAAAERKGCASLLTEDKQRECREGPQKAKHDACNVKSSCSPRDQEDLVAKYKEVQKRRSEGTLNRSDKDAFERRLRDIKSDLIQHYKDQKSKHIDGSGSPSFQAEERLESCKKVEGQSC
jgi:hypothetical protein